MPSKTKTALAALFCLCLTGLMHSARANTVSLTQSDPLASCNVLLARAGDPQNVPWEIIQALQQLPDEVKVKRLTELFTVDFPIFNSAVFAKGYVKTGTVATYYLAPNAPKKSTKWYLSNTGERGSYLGSTGVATLENGAWTSFLNAIKAFDSTAFPDARQRALKNQERADALGITVQELETVSQLVTHIQNDDALKALTQKSLMAYLDAHSSDVYRLGASQNSLRDRLPELRDKVRHFGWQAAAGVTAGGLVTLAVTHNPVAIGAGLLVPAFMEGYTQFKNYIQFRTSLKHLQRNADKDDKLRHGTLSKVTRLALQSAESPEVNVTADDLRELKPQLDITSEATIINYGAEVEHGISKLNRELNKFNQNRAEDPVRVGFHEELKNIVASKKPEKLRIAEVHARLTPFLTELRLKATVDLKTVEGLTSLSKILTGLHGDTMQLLNDTKASVQDQELLQALEKKDSRLQQFQLTLKTSELRVSVSKGQIQLEHDYTTTLLLHLDKRLNDKDQPTMTEEDLKILKEASDALSTL